MKPKKPIATNPPGRPPEGPIALRNRIELRCTDEQKEKLDRLGGAAWIRQRIDRAKAGEQPTAEPSPA